MMRGMVIYGQGSEREDARWAKADSWASRPYHSSCDSHGGIAEKKGAPIRFCETNPPFSRGFFVATATPYVACDGNAREISVGSFWKTNPPDSGFGGVLD